MNPAWSIYNGGRLNSQITESSVFTVKSDDTLDGILFRSASMKQIFAQELRCKLSALKVKNNYMHPLSLDFQSIVAVGDAGRYVELSVVIMDEANAEMLWYFMLRSPENSISQVDLSEIVSIILLRLAPERVARRNNYGIKQ